MYDPTNPPLVSFAKARAAFVGGEDSPRAFLERCIAVIEAREAEVRAFVTLDIEGARKAADAASKRYRDGEPLSALDGCPVGIKDIMETTDMPTQMNSPFYEGWESRRDAACVHALRKAGAVPIGKTVTTEFACGASGPTRNPHDPARTPGGSSSGSAAGVGSGMLPVALGTQTRASTIRPASFCGAYAFKPTHGALNVGGVHPVALSQDHLGVIAASLGECWETGRIIADLVGGDAGRSGLCGPMVLPAPVMPKRLARLDTPGWAETDGESKAGFDRLIETLAAAGAEIVDRAGDARVAALEEALEGSDLFARRLIAYEMRWPYGHYREREPSKLGKPIHEYLALSDQMTPEDYRELLAGRENLRDMLSAFAGDVDGFITLAASGPAPSGLQHTGSRAFLVPWTLMGAPTFSLPLLASEGLPVGVQVMGYVDRDVELAAIAAWVEAAARSRGSRYQA